MKVLLVEDHVLFREGLRLLLGEIDPDVDVTGVSSQDQALEKLKGIDFDLVLLDLKLGQESGLDALAAIKQDYPDLPVVVLSGSEATRDVRDAIGTGASGYIVKASSQEVLKHSIRLVLTGETVVPLPASYATETVGAASNSDSNAADGGSSQGRLSSLTIQEVKVLELIRVGMSNKEIGRELGVIEGTVKVHVKSILRKLGAKNRTAAAIMVASEEAD